MEPFAAADKSRYSDLIYVVEDDPDVCQLETVGGGRVTTPSPSDRKHFPVFVMGCHRSGTNLLYDMLLSSGGFAIHRGFLPIYKMLIPRFGSMKSRANREKILETWLRSKGFRRIGLDAEPLSARILNECRSGGDFIRVVMDSVAPMATNCRCPPPSAGGACGTRGCAECIPPFLAASCG